MSLKAAVGCSVLFHLGLLAVRLSPGLLFPPKESQPIEVTYIFPEPSPEPASPPLEKKLLESVQPGKADPAPRPKSSWQPAQERLSVRPAAPARVEPVIQEPAPLPPTAGSVPSVSSLPDEEFAAIEHKEAVRERLRSFLLYPSAPMEGTVRLRLALTPQGILQEVTVLEASNSGLESVAIRDARRAAPYPRFPSKMRQPQADYEFLVRYAPD